MAGIGIGIVVVVGIDIAVSIVISIAIGIFIAVAVGISHFAHSFGQSSFQLPSLLLLVLGTSFDDSGNHVRLSNTNRGGSGNAALCFRRCLAVLLLFLLFVVDALSKRVEGHDLVVKSDRLAPVSLVRNPVPIEFLWRRIFALRKRIPTIPFEGKAGVLDAERELVPVDLKKFDHVVSEQHGYVRLGEVR